MDIMVQWFWLVKLSLALVTIYVAYKAFFEKKFKSKVWNVMAGILLVLAIVQPVKMDVQTKVHTDRANIAIEQSKVLPDKVQDNSFEKSTNVKGISKEEIWSK